VKAICLPSGDHRRSDAASLSLASLTVAPPVRTGATWIDAATLSPVPRVEVKASRVPSGDHVGLASLCSPEVNGSGGDPPLVATSQIWLW
jgi:hypothetical protein